MMSMTRDRKRSLVLAAFVALALVLGGELGLRLYAYYFRHPHQALDSHLGIVKLVPGYHASFHGRTLRINSRGFRGDEFAFQKPPGVLRIIMLGDSVTFGLYGEGCDYPGVVQAGFNEDRPGRVEVINAGVEGYDSQDALRILQLELTAYRPDIITVMIGWNDLLKRDPAQPGAPEWRARLAYALYDVYLIKFWRSVIYRDARRALLRPRTDLPPEEEAALRRYVPTVYKENLTNIVLTAREKGSNVVLLALHSPLRPDMPPDDVHRLANFPYYTYNVRKFWLLYERYNATIRDLGNKLGVVVVEPSKVLLGRERELYFDYAHLECEGQRILGNYLHRVLSGLIDKSALNAAELSPWTTAAVTPTKRSHQ